MSALTLDRGLTDTTETTRGDRLMPNATCTIEGCQSGEYARGWCSKHYQRARKGKDPTIEPYAPAGSTCTIEGCGKPHHSRGWCAMHFERWKRRGDVTAEPLTTRGRVIVVEPTYRGLHTRLQSQRGRASEHVCVECGGQAQEWAYDHTDPNELTDVSRTGITLRYSLDTERYQPRCKPCHIRFDQPPPTHCPQGHEYTPENTGTNSGRYCKACNVARGRNENLTDEQRKRRNARKNRSRYALHGALFGDELRVYFDPRTVQVSPTGRPSA